MKRFLGVVIATVLLGGPVSPARADERDAQAILDKAIQALGGEEALKKAEAMTWKGKGTITFNDQERQITFHATVQGLDHYRGEIESDEFHGVTILSGSKGWRKFGDNETRELEDEALANTKRTVYLQVIPVTLVALKGKDFKIEAAGEEKAGDKPAVAIKVTPPDGKEFTLAFDKASGLPVKLVARVVGFQGNEFTQETTFADYKEFGGIKKATKLVSKRDGEKFRDEEITEFKILDKVDSKTFSQPE
jgi:hypothetical protein